MCFVVSLLLPRSSVVCIKVAKNPQILVRNAGEMPRIYSEDVIFRVAFAAVFLVLNFPCEKIGGNPVSTFIFKGRPVLFHVFLMLLAFAFSAASLTMSFREIRHPKFAGCFRWLALCSTAAAAGVLMLSLLLPSSPINLDIHIVMKLGSPSSFNTDYFPRPLGKSPAPCNRGAILEHVLRSNVQAVPEWRCSPRTLATRVNATPNSAQRVALEEFQFVKQQVPYSSKVRAAAARRNSSHDKARTEKQPANDGKNRSSAGDNSRPTRLNPSNTDPTPALLHNRGDPGARLAEQQAVPDGGAPRTLATRVNAPLGAARRSEDTSPYSSEPPSIEHPFPAPAFPSSHNSGSSLLARARDSSRFRPLLRPLMKVHDVHNLFWTL
nr:COPII coat assembly protein [Ipomoea batatas]